MSAEDVWRQRAAAFGSYLRTERKLAEMSLRELAAQSRVSNAYLSQLERGLHQPSVRVVRSIAAALDIPQDRLLTRLGLLENDISGADSDRAGEPAVEAAIRADDRLDRAQQDALIAVYHSYLHADGTSVRRT